MYKSYNLLIVFQVKLSFKSSFKFQAMNIKTLIANSSKDIENIAENNIRNNININIIIERKLNSMLLKEVDLKKEIIETLT